MGECGCGGTVLRTHLAVLKACVQLFAASNLFQDIDAIPQFIQYVREAEDNCVHTPDNSH